MKFAVYGKVKAGREDDFRAALREFIPTVSAEEGTLQYEVCQGDEDPTSFVFFEAYRDEAASKVHMESEAFKNFFAEIGPMLESPPLTLNVIESAK
jgi:quinol monooxygenase YgiN